MNPKLSPEVTEALQAAGNKSLSVDGADGKTYVVVSQDVHLKAMDALREREDEEAIQQGIADMELGNTFPIEELESRLEARLQERRTQ